jgi:hypothetical protein
MKNAVKFEEILKPRLQDSEQAAKYLTACFEEGPDVFLLGLRDVVEAQGGIGRAAKSSHLNRERSEPIKGVKGVKPYICPVLRSPPCVFSILHCSWRW